MVAAPAPAAAREEVDLNKVSEFRLKAAKLEMDVGFSQSLKAAGRRGRAARQAGRFEPAGDSDGSWDDWLRPLRLHVQQRPLTRRARA